VQRPIPVDSRISGRWGEEISTGIRASGAGILYHFASSRSLLALALAFHFICYLLLRQLLISSAAVTPPATSYQLPVTKSKSSKTRREGRRRRGGGSLAVPITANVATVA
jgi:hypothetical protein